MQQLELADSKHSIIMNNNLEELCESFINFLTEVDYVPFVEDRNPRYLCSLRSNNAGMTPLQLTWGWTEKDLKKKDTGFSLNDVQEVTYENNLESLIDCYPNVTMSVRIIFPLLECIRRHVNEKSPIYFVTGENCTYVFL